MSVLKVFPRTDGSVVELAFTERRDGDFHIDAEPVALFARRHAVMTGEWSVVRQVHGATVVDAADVTGSALDAPEADGIVTGKLDQPIAVQGADCAPLAFVTDKGPIGVAHAGWRGLQSGVVNAVVAELRDRGAEVEAIVVGPVIGTECYEFGADDLNRVVESLGDTVRGTTPSGSPALDMRAAIVAAAKNAGVTDVSFVRPCTGCGDGGFSHRVRQESQRHALVARIVS